MSTLGTAIGSQPSKDDKPIDEQPANGDKTIIPDWAYGVIAGGSATIVTAGAVAYHLVSRSQRKKAAEADAKLLNQEHLVTPRVAEVTSRFSPRPGEKIV